MKYFLVLSILFYNQVTAQDSTALHSTTTTLHLSALGGFKYPGIRAGIDYPVKNKIIEKNKKRGKKIVYKDRYLTANYGFYHHSNFHTAHFIHAGYELRRTNKNGWFLAFEPQLGLTRTVIADAVYLVDENGKVTKKKAAGNFYFSPALSFNLGKDFTNSKLPVSIYSKLTLYTCLPYNNFVYERFLVEAGVSIPLTELIN